MLDNFFSIISLLGIGGAIGTYLRIIWERKNKAQIQKQEFKEKRYKCLILLLWVSLDFDREKRYLWQEPGRQNLKTVEDLMDELQREFHNAILFASEKVLFALQKFIEKPSKENFLQTALAMREDLWGGKVSIDKLQLQCSLPEKN